MKTDVINRNSYGELVISNEAYNALQKNGTYLPSVKRVVFNLKTTEKVQVKNEDGSDKYVEAKDRDGKPILRSDGTPVMRAEYETKRTDYPVLVTKVWWSDGTSTTVRNSAEDKVATEMKKLSNGDSVEVATDAAKTFGLMAAVVKRTCGYPDENGEIIETNMGKILSDIVKSGYDQNVEAAETKIQKAERKANQKSERKAKPSKRYSYADLAQMLGPVLEKFTANPDILNTFVNCLNSKI